MGGRGAARAEEQRRYSHQCLPDLPPTTWLPPFSCPPPPAPGINTSNPAYLCFSPSCSHSSLHVPFL